MSPVRLYDPDLQRQRLVTLRLARRRTGGLHLEPRRHSPHLAETAGQRQRGARSPTAPTTWRAFRPTVPRSSSSTTRKTTRHLYRTAVLGGQPRKVMDNVTEADWSPDGTPGGLPADVADERPPTSFPWGSPTSRPAPKECWPRWTTGCVYGIRWSPDGRWIVMTENALSGNLVAAGQLDLVDSRNRGHPATAHHRTDRILHRRRLGPRREILPRRQDPGTAVAHHRPAGPVHGVFPGLGNPPPPVLVQFPVTPGRLGIRDHRRAERPPGGRGQLQAQRHSAGIPLARHGRKRHAQGSDHQHRFRPATGLFTRRQTRPVLLEPGRQHRPVDGRAGHRRTAPADRRSRPRLGPRLFAGQPAHPVEFQPRRAHGSLDVQPGRQRGPPGYPGRA